MQDSIKLFDIPVYGLNKQVLKKRIDTITERIKEDCRTRNAPEDTQLALIELQTYPMRNWEYNHIVGFIQISIDKQDILFSIYLPYEYEGHTPKYLWWAHKKHFVRESGISGLHFWLGNMKTNEEICKRTVEMLHGIISEHIPKRYFVDTQAFDAINNHIDYISLLQKQDL